MLSNILTNLLLFLLITTTLATPPPLCAPYTNKTGTHLHHRRTHPPLRRQWTNTTLPTSPCPLQTAHPTLLTHMNSLYPTNHTATTRLFMILRSVTSSIQVATHIQFRDLLPEAQDCTLQLLLPSDSFMDIRGASPSFGVWQLKWEDGALASWTDYVGAKYQNGSFVDGFRRPANETDCDVEEHDEEFLGVVNGDKEAVEGVRRNGGTVVVAPVECNRTLTFQMGMLREGVRGEPNYWDFVDVKPPAWPVQGWRIVHSVGSC